MSKYQTLGDHLAGMKASEWRASFAEIEAVLGFQLPKTALTSDAWWSNETDKAHKRSWLDADWRVDDIDRREGKVVFARTAKAVAEPPPVALVETPAESPPKRGLSAGLIAAVGGMAAVAVGVGLLALKGLKRR
jgi:hypothetical protein